MKHHNNHSNKFGIILIVFGFITIISGLTAGAVLLKEDILGTYYTYTEKHFNWELMIYIWTSGGLFELFLYGIYAHLQNQEIMIDNFIIDSGEKLETEIEAVDSAIGTDIIDTDIKVSEKQATEKE